MNIALILLCVLDFFIRLIALVGISATGVQYIESVLLWNSYLVFLFFLSLLPLILLFFYKYKVYLRRFFLFVEILFIPMYLYFSFFVAIPSFILFFYLKKHLSFKSEK